MALLTSTYNKMTDEDQWFVRQFMAYDGKKEHPRDPTTEQITAWATVVVALFQQYPPSTAYARLETVEFWRRNAGKTPLVPSMSFFWACMTGVPEEELLTAYLMIFGSRE